MTTISRGLTLAMKRLPCRERRVLYLRYEMRMSLPEVAKAIKQTKRQTEAIYEKAMGRLVRVLGLE